MSLKEKIFGKICPKCKKTKLKKFRRVYYPFGKKSKKQVISGKRCPECYYIESD